VTEHDFPFRKCESFLKCEMRRSGKWKVRK